MRAITLTLLICALQPSHAASQIYPPVTARQTLVLRLGAGGNLQLAIDQAAPGDVIELSKGAVFTGNFVLPQKSGTSYITIRTEASDGQPSADQRVRPDHAPLLARIQSPNGSPALRTAAGAHHWRLTLLEFGPNQGGAGDILTLGDGSSSQSSLDRVPRDLIVDRCYIHGDPRLGQKRGIALNSAATVVIGSHISDIKAVGVDAQAIAGWNGPGPFQIENNYLEASGENFLLGGATPGITGLVPSDVVFRRNHVSRPVAWRSESWTVKNLFELKNARRVLVEGNLFENHWQGGQPGYAIVLTPRGERGAASWASVEDVTFRSNIVRNVAAVFNLLARDDAGASGPLRRLRIADNLIYDVDRAVWGGNGAFLQIGEGPSDIVVESNTIVQTGNIITAYGGTREAPSAAERFVFQNNIALHNANGVIGQGLAIGNDTLTKYFPGGVFLRNVLAGGVQSRYPSDNLFPAIDWLLQQFENAGARDYRLRATSELRQSSTDRRELGASFAALLSAFGSTAPEWLGPPLTPASSEMPERRGRPPAYIR